MTGPDTLGHVHRYQPPATADAPTLLLLHGTGGDETDLLPLGTALHEQAGLLAVRGAVAEHGMPRFFRRHAEGVFDTEDLAHRDGITDGAPTWESLTALSNRIAPRVSLPEQSGGKCNSFR